MTTLEDLSQLQSLPDKSYEQANTLDLTEEELENDVGSRSNLLQATLEDESLRQSLPDEHTNEYKSSTTDSIETKRSLENDVSGTLEAETIEIDSTGEAKGKSTQDIKYMRRFCEIPFLNSDLQYLC